MSDNGNNIAAWDGMTFIIKNPYMDMKIKMVAIFSAIRLVKTKTKAKTIDAGIERMHHMAMDKKEMEDFGTLLTFMRCMNDGSVKPPVDVNELYSNIERFDLGGVL